MIQAHKTLQIFNSEHCISSFPHIINQSIRPPMRLIPDLSSTAKRFVHLIETCTSISHIPQIQAQLIRHNLLHSNTTIAYHFITTSQSFNLLNSSLFLLFTQTPPHIFIYNTLIRSFSHSQTPQLSLSIFTHMHKNSISPNHYTFPFLLKSLSDLKAFKQGQFIHAHVIKLGHVNDIYVKNSLLNLYASCWDMGLCRKVFDEMPDRDVVSWTVMITGYREVGKFDDALIAFEQMQYDGVEPNRVTMVNALAACAGFGALDMGVWIHGCIRRSGWEMDVILGTSLIDMYGKCGRIEEGLNVFNFMREKNVFTWNAIIKGLALAKSGEEAVSWFSRMELEGIKPDEVTLLGVLCACAHSGMVQTGREIFSSITEGNYGFAPNVKHYASMVHLLASSGCLEDAFRVIKEMPFEDTTIIWGAFLGGCRARGNLELSEFAAWKLLELAPGNSAYYVVLSNLYAEMGRWSDVEKIRRLMKERDLEKDLGSSSVELQPREQLSELLA